MKCLNVGSKLLAEWPIFQYLFLSKENVSCLLWTFWFVFLLQCLSIFLGKDFSSLATSRCFYFNSQSSEQWWCQLGNSSLDLPSLRNITFSQCSFRYFKVSETSKGCKNSICPEMERRNGKMYWKDYGTGRDGKVDCTN